MRFGSDTGGTFTDLVDETGAVLKVLSTPNDPSLALASGLKALTSGREALPSSSDRVETLTPGREAHPSSSSQVEALTPGREAHPSPPAQVKSRPGVRPGHPSPPAQVKTLAHGTTVATNAILERDGAAVALVTNAGFADVIEIARQNRPSLYDSFADRPAPLVPRKWRYEVAGRLAADGSELTPLNTSALSEIDESVEAVAVCLLHSDLNPAHEEAVRRELERRGFNVTTSSSLAPEFREYERTSTVVMNAYVRPKVSSYLRSLQGLAAEVLVMTSAGGLVPALGAAAEPVRLLLSGPAGGVRAGAYYAEINGFPNAVTFDMGGTSTDVCLVEGGRPGAAAQRSMAGFPVRMPALDVLTIGAGGGSIAEVDAGGALKVGPRSAGADPGPACYARGGLAATVTDANLAAGRIPADAVLGDLGRLDASAAEEALRRRGLSASDVLGVVNSNMIWALRQVTVERGVDPSEVALVAFGGAGPLHACDLAEALGMPAVIVPPRAGALSAVGILGGPRQHDVVKSWPTPDNHDGLEAAARELAHSARQALAGGGGGLGSGGGDGGVRGAGDGGAGAGGSGSAGGDAGGGEGDGGAGAGEGGVRGAGDGGAGAEGSGSAGGDAGGVEVVVSYDCRYAGQSHELTVSAPSEFHEVHRLRNGYAREGDPIEVVALRVRASRSSPVALSDLPALGRQAVDGPEVIAEEDSGTWIPPGWRAEVGEAGAWVIRRKQKS